MKLRTPKTSRPILPKNARFLTVTDSPRLYVVDAHLYKRLARVPWHYIPARRHARGYFGASQTREYLHRYVLQLLGQPHQLVCFANGDRFDCRQHNLKSYDPSEDGANRRLFSNSSTRYKGVTFVKSRNKWVAMIRIKGKLKFLGYHSSPKTAAQAYEDAWKLAHVKKAAKLHTAFTE